MNKLNISRNSFTDLFWKIIFQNGTQIIEQAKSNIASKHIYFEKLRDLSEYNTGSISASSAVSLTLLTSYFRPSLIAEVGTFIGRSTYSLTIGHELNGVAPPLIHTCDYSNNINLDFKNIIQYKKQSSTEMLTSLVNNKIIPEMYLLDGRIQESDIPLLLELQAEDAIFLLDDFEGTEKGVSNAFTLTNVFKNNFLVAYPASQTLLNTYGLTDASTTAALIPIKKVGFVNQG
ncbi:MAG: hypothetical protein RI902_346 [Pseudomonadota bacterium]|jgi:hypothetical protein